MLASRQFLARQILNNDDATVFLDLAQQQGQTVPLCGQVDRECPQQKTRTASDAFRHCEERGDEAIQLPAQVIWIASLRSQ